MIWLHSAAFLRFWHFSHCIPGNTCGETLWSQSYWKICPDKRNFVILINKSLRLWKTWYLKHLMARSHAHAKLHFDVQIHNLLIRLYCWHDVWVTRLSIKPCEGTVETESKTDCWGWLFFLSSSSLSPSSCLPQIERTNPFFAREYPRSVHYCMNLFYIETVVISAY